MELWYKFGIPEGSFTPSISNWWQAAAGGLDTIPKDWHPGGDWRPITSLGFFTGIGGRLGTEYALPTVNLDLIEPPSLLEGRDHFFPVSWVVEIIPTPQSH